MSAMYSGTRSYYCISSAGGYWWLLATHGHIIITEVDSGTLNKFFQINYVLLTRWFSKESNKRPIQVQSQNGHKYTYI